MCFIHIILECHMTSFRDSRIKNSRISKNHNFQKLKQATTTHLKTAKSK
jgi:hypothetical protein